MNLDISIDDREWRAVPGLRGLARKAVSAVLPDDDVAIGLLFTSDAQDCRDQRLVARQGQPHQCPVISGFGRNACA